MKKIRVVLGIGGLHGGGAERQIITILKHLDRSRFEPFLYVVYRTGPLVQEVPPDVPIVAFDERWQGSRWPGILMHRRRVADMSDYLNEIKADVCYDRTFLMTLIAAEAAQATHTPNISTVVTEPRHAFPLLAGRFQNMKKRILKRLYLNSTQVLANSNGAARAAEQFYGLPAQQISTIYNAIDLERIQSLQQASVEHPWWDAPSKRSVFRIVTAGRLTTQKGFDLLIESVALLQKANPHREIRLAILGEGVDRETFQVAINRHQLQNQVFMPGFQANPIGWYSRADLMALPSTFEGFPNVLMEAMACGTAVLSTDCPFGPSELLDSGRWGQLIPVGDLNQLTAAIQKHLSDPGSFLAQAKAAQKFVRDTFDTQTIIDQLEERLIAASWKR